MNSADAVVRNIARAVHDAGGRALLVGGCVRDVLMGEMRKDFDLEVFGLPAARLEELLLREHAIVDVGRSFGVLKLRHLPIDVSLPRRESKVARGHKGFAIDADPHLDLKSAAERRDLTINALYEDPLTGEILDPLGGRTHLASKTLRHCSSRFVEDPLRLLRVMQFAARLQFQVSPETIELCRSLDLMELPRERLEGEWRKLLLLGRKPSLGLYFLKDCGALRFFPEIEALVSTPQNPAWHPEGDVFVHTGHCLDHFASERAGDATDWTVGLALLCHDFGKPSTTKLIDGEWRALGHSEAGEAPTLRFLERLTAERDVVEQVVQLVLDHLRPYELWREKASDSAIRRLAMRGSLKLLVRVARHDSAGRPPLVFDDFPAGHWLLDRAEALSLADQAPRPILKGRHLIELGEVPGPHFRAILDRCFEAQLEGRFHDLDGGLPLLREELERWRRQRSG